MLNKVQVIGHLGGDPETKYSQAGTAVTSFSVATTERWKNQAGEQQERTEWHRVTAFGKLGEICGEYLRKGGQVYVEGKLQTDKWTDSDGVDRYTTKIIASEMRMLGGKRDGEPQQQRAPQRGAPPPQSDIDDDAVPF